MAKVVIFFVAFFLSGVNLIQGQIVGLEQGDFLTTDSNVISIRVIKFEYNSSPMNISVHPLTISQYEALGVGGCDLSSGDDPAEADDFNTTVMEVFVPANTNRVVYTFNITLTQDNVVEPLETFVVLLNVSGGDTVTVTRNCTVVKVKEIFNGQFLRWSHDGQEVTPTTLSLSYPEGNASHVIIRAERLVEAELTTTITIMKQQQITTLSPNDFSIPSSYSIPPERSFVNIVLTLFDDSAIETDEMVQIEVIAVVPQIGLGTNRSRHVRVEVIDDEVLNYEFLSPAQITVTEGDNITLVSGLNPMVDNNYRNKQLGQITTENGTAKEGTDFHKVYQAFVINNRVHYQEVRTISRAGVQPTRNFTIHLAPLLTSNYTLIHGVVMIEILDNSKPPLAPNISSFGFFKEDPNELHATWSQEVSDIRPLDNFLIIIKTCTKLPCEIDPNSPKEDEKIHVLSNNTRELLHSVKIESAVFRIVLCAENALGRNCSSLILQAPTNAPFVKETEKSPDNTFIIWVVVLCVLLVLLCCLLPLIILVVCCLYKRNRKTSCSPSINKGRQLNGQSPDSISIDSYMEEMKGYELNSKVNVLTVPTVSASIQTRKK